MRILIDMDGILADILTPWISEYNERFVENPAARLSSKDIIHFDIHKCTKSPAEDLRIYDIIEQQGFFSKLKPITGAVEAIDKLALKHELVILSTANTPWCYGEKVQWLKWHFPMFNKKNTILTGAKHMVVGDVLIDDSPQNAINYLNHHPKAKVVGIEYPYNSACLSYEHLFSTDHKATAWSRIVDWVDWIVGLGDDSEHNNRHP
jgi:5'(3')-deoxyribonucleotidase